MCRRTARKQTPEDMYGDRPMPSPKPKTDSLLREPKGVLSSYLNMLLVNNDYAASLNRASCGWDFLPTPGMLTTPRVSEPEVLNAIAKANKGDPAVARILLDIRNHPCASENVKKALAKRQ